MDAEVSHEQIVIRHVLRDLHKRRLVHRQLNLLPVPRMHRDQSVQAQMPEGTRLLPQEPSQLSTDSRQDARHRRYAETLANGLERFDCWLTGDLIFEALQECRQALLDLGLQRGMIPAAPAALPEAFQRGLL